MAEPIGVMMMAYGGPDKLEQVEPYLLNVRGGRHLSEAALKAALSRYKQIGGRSPILERTEDQARALQDDLDRQGGSFRIFVGMRHWHPYIHAALEAACAEGIHRLVGIVMAPHYSRMSIGAYYKRLDESIRSLETPIELVRIESWHRDPGYLDTLQSRIDEGLERFPEQVRPAVHLVFTAHSLPERILEWDDPYPQQLEETYEAIRARFPGQIAHFAYQSAAETPEVWLGPDAGDRMLELIEQEVKNFLVVPIGFVSEHVEILYDIDIDFRGRVESLGGRLERIEMPGADRRMMESLAREIRHKAVEQGWL